jgi:aspartate 1-decarboxylase
MALRGNVGDKLLVITYVAVDDDTARTLRPQVLLMEGTDNRRFVLKDG